MTRHRHVLVAALLLAACARAPQVPPPSAVPAAPVAVGDAAPTALVPVPAGDYVPLFPGRDGKKKVPVPAFRLEERPVTNAQFLAFVGQVPQWRRGAVARLFADADYLATWRSDLDPGDADAALPVTHVSWFAARAYARWCGRRLPKLAEWELVAAAPLPGGVAATRAVLDWYARPSTGPLPPAGSGPINALGVRDLTGVVWEWVDDFSAAMVTGDGRGDSDLARSLFCGAGAVGAARPEDYAAFMRFAFRGSLRAEFTVKNLGFRCAADDAAKE